MHILRNRKFLTLLVAIFTSQFGDTLRVMSLTYWVFIGSNESPFARLAQILLIVIPSIVLSPVAGVLSDRWNRRHIIIASDVLRAFVSCGLVVAIVFQVLPLTFLLIALGATITVFFEPARFSFLPQVVDNPDDLIQANSLVETGTQALSVLGPGIATLIYFSLGGGWAFALDALTFIISALAINLIRFDIPNDVETVETSPETDHSFVKEAIYGVNYLFRTPATAFFLLTTLGLTITSAANQISILFLIAQALRQPISTLGWVYTISAFAQLLSAIVVTLFAKRINPSKMLVLAMAMISITQVGIGLAPNIFILVIWVLLGTLANAPYSISYDTVLQQAVDEAIMGRVYGVISAIESSARIVVLGTSALAITYIGPRISLVSAGMLGLGCAVIGGTSLIPAMRAQSGQQQTSQK